jgi:predicted permease
VTLDQATADATNAHRRSYDGPNENVANARISVGPLRFGRSGKESSEALISRWLAGLSVVVLLVACANIVNLLLARAVKRRREMAVRVALGAGRARLLRLLLMSSLALAMIGAAAGLIVAAAAGTLVRRLLLPEVDWTSGPVDGHVLGFSLLVALVTGVAIGLLPALRAGSVDIVSSLKAGVREGGGNRSVVRGLLMMAQAALAMLLLVGAGLFVRSLDRVRGLDLGLRPERVVWLAPRWPRIPETTTPADRTREETRRDMFANGVLERIQAAPGVEHAAVTIGMPFGTTMSITLRIPGRDSLPHLPGGFRDPDVSVASPDYFATMGTRLLRGRTFSATDGFGTERVAIVSETMAKTLWPGGNALGECLLIGGGVPQPDCSRVVGIVQDVRRSRIHEDPLMHYYVPFGQVPKLTGSELVVRPRGEAAASITTLRALVREADPSITYVDAGTLQDRIDPQIRSWRIGAMMFSLFAVLALIVAAVGTFSLVSYLVEQRRHEIGVRVALGARAIDVVTLMLQGAIGISAAGVAVGAVIALAAGRLIQSLLFETSAQDPAVIGSVAFVLISVSIVASVLPALRARRVDPITALRDE